MNKLKKLIPCISRRKTEKQTLELDYTDEIPCITSSETSYERPILNNTVIMPCTPGRQPTNEISNENYGDGIPMVVSSEIDNQRFTSDNTSIIPLTASSQTDTGRSELNDTSIVPFSFDNPTDNDGSILNDTFISLFNTGNQTNNEISSQSAIEPGRNNARILQNFHLIWLDNNIDDNNTDCRNTIMQLQRIINTINTFTNGEECVEFLENMQNDKAYIIISGTLGQQIVPCIHNMSQVDSIFIFCSNKAYHEQWIKDWSKIEGVFTEIDPICEVLKNAVKQSIENAIPISIMATDGDILRRRLDQRDPSFMYTQILIEILLSISFDETHIGQFIQYCREIFVDNEHELRNIQKFEGQYHHRTPIWWYTCESFLYPMLNRALRLLDVDIITRLGFFINDLQRHIDELHKEQSADVDQRFIVYRGQGMTKHDFQQLCKTKGGLLAFNHFLSTSKNREVSFRFARHSMTNPDLVGILFVMTVDPGQSTTPFAWIDGVSSYKAEDEVLFSMHTVFRIDEITPMDGNRRLFRVDLTLTSDNDEDFCMLTDSIRKETDLIAKGWYRLGLVLLKLGYCEKAREVYQTLLDQTTEESEKGVFYHQLGWTTDVLGHYSKALILYEKALQIWQHSLPPNHLDLASCYNNVGGVYQNTGEYSKALSCYDKALEISQQSLPPNDPDLAKSYIAFGLVYNAIGEQSKSLGFYGKALEIQQQSLPANHPDLAISYNNIGGVYYSMGEYSKALSSYEKALEIQQASLPSDHFHFAMSYNNLGNVYYKMRDNSKALLYHQKALEIHQKTWEPTHLDLASSYNNIGVVYDNIGEYSQALSYYEKALEIQEQSLPPNHPGFAASYNNIGAAYENMTNYSEACSYYERALEIGKQSLPANHPILQQRQMNLDRVKSNL